MRRRSWQRTVLIVLFVCLTLCVSLADCSQPLVPGPSGVGDTGMHVRLLQRELLRRGYLAGEANGVYTDETIKAVERFQRDRGLIVDGRAGETTLIALFAWALVDPACGGNILEAMPGEGCELTGMPAPSGLGARGNHVKRLQAELQRQGYPNAAPDDLFSENMGSALAAFQKDGGLRSGDRVDSDTLHAPFGGRPADAAATEKLDWYGGGSEWIPRGAVFQVQDVRTGKTFACRRMEGVAHLDAEPLSPYDTFVMLGLFGGEWSWDRRPILLRVGGRVVAASMNGKPHGFSSITDNAMKGHFCIHFFGSRNHNTGRVSDTHQACVIEATRAVWRQE